MNPLLFLSEFAFFLKVREMGYSDQDWGVRPRKGPGATDSRVPQRFAFHLPLRKGKWEAWVMENFPKRIKIPSAKLSSVGNFRGPWPWPERSTFQKLWEIPFPCGRPHWTQPWKCLSNQVISILELYLGQVFGAWCLSPVLVSNTCWPVFTFFPSPYRTRQLQRSWTSSKFCWSGLEDKLQRDFSKPLCKGMLTALGKSRFSGIIRRKKKWKAPLKPWKWELLGGRSNYYISHYTALERPIS